MGLIINNVTGYSCIGSPSLRSEFEMSFPAKATLQILVPVPNESLHNPKRALIHLGHIPFMHIIFQVANQVCVLGVETILRTFTKRRDHVRKPHLRHHCLFQQRHVPDHTSA
jgi:hypothetical protein